MLRTIGFVIGMHAIVAAAQEPVQVQKGEDNTINVLIGNKPFTTFLYPDTLEKPVLYPIHAANGTLVTRGYPLAPRAGEPTDHPHHLGLWFNFENVNGLDFWNNSFAINAGKKHLYGWVTTKKITQIKSGQTGSITYQADWTNQQKNVLLKEVTTYTFGGSKGQRIIDRVTRLTADTLVTFKDAKDGMLGLRLAHELQIPTVEDKKYTDDKGIVTMVKGSPDTIANGNYLTSEGKTGDAAWSTRGVWCKVYGMMQQDSVSVTIIDHPSNINYPTFWHARGYGLFAANPLGKQVFTNEPATNLQLKKGESVVFKYRVVINNGEHTPTPATLNKLAAQFAKQY